MSGLGLLRRALAVAKRRGVLESTFAGEVLRVSPTTLWRIKKGDRPLKPREVVDLRAFVNSRLVLVAFLALSALGCSLEAIAGVPVQRRPWCRASEVTNAADSTSTRALGSVYRNVPCEPWHRDTVR